MERFTQRILVVAVVVFSGSCSAADKDLLIFPVEVKIERAQGEAGMEVVSLSASVTNNSDRALCVPLYSWREVNNQPERLFYVYDTQNNSIPYQGIAIERRDMEDEFRVIPPGATSKSSVKLSDSYAFPKGRHKYALTVSLFGVYCSVLEAGLIEVPRPLFLNTRESDAGLSHWIGKGVLLQSEKVEFEVEK
ncbi:MAG: hypothetical protein LCH56_06470 [Proteobacteria bacterium]|nr:hypothetical protein [Pseudomonadota bacterium]